MLAPVGWSSPPVRFTAGRAARWVGSKSLYRSKPSSTKISQSAGVRALMVHAIDDEAVTFYLQYGFVLFPADSRTMFLPIETLAASL